ncbi:MAG: hypothetical protein CMF74_02070 [Maricaulis sp.]|jgi:hypothetical protein|nr:hypothetical protein [Maricaulis sp.]HAQ35551.1 hypothetical protein [Alphaproteobacteria bacterium]
MKQRAIAVGIIAIVAACSTVQNSGMTNPGTAPMDPDAPTCAAPDMQYLVGQRIGEVDTATLPQPMRVVPHGMAVTMDYRGDRTTVWLTEDDRVERVVCG